MTNVAYCPGCGAILGPVSTDAQGRITWSQCVGRFCKMKTKRITTDQKGFIIYPKEYQDRYIHARNWDEP